jgi:hypothetical protein
MNDTIEERRRFAGLLTALSDYYKSDISKAVAGIYWNGLKQYDYEAIEQACWAHTQLPDESGRWMPRNSDIIKLLDGNTSDQAAMAWSKVDYAIRVRGPYDDLVFDDALIHRVASDMGGWIKLCGTDEKEYPFIAKEFQTRYRSYRTRTGGFEYPARLIGVSNSHNEANNQPLLPPILLGDVEKAKQIVRSGQGASVLAIALKAPLQITQEAT